MGIRVKCPDDINERRILTAPAITLSDHRAVYDAKCGRPQRGRVVTCRHLRTKGRGYEKGSSFCGRTLWTTPYGWRPEGEASPEASRRAKVSLSVLLSLCLCFWSCLSVCFALPETYVSLE